jgi:hypothetical protein
MNQNVRNVDSFTRIGSISARVLCLDCCLVFIFIILSISTNAVSVDLFLSELISLSHQVGIETVFSFLKKDVSN